MDEEEQQQPPTKKQRVECNSSINNDNTICCAACNKRKGITCFSNSQLRKGKYAKRCKHCIIMKRDFSDNNKQIIKDLKEKKIFEVLDEGVKQVFERFLFAKRKVGYYENLCHDILDSDVCFRRKLDYIDKKLIQFKPNIRKSQDELIGAYDIFYCAMKGSSIDGIDTVTNRSINGTLTLSWKDNIHGYSRGNNGETLGDDGESNPQKVLHGDVNIDLKYLNSNSFGFPCNDFTFDQFFDHRDELYNEEPIFVRETNEDCFIPFKVKTKNRPNRDLIREGDNKPTPGKLKVISKRNAIGRRGIEGYMHGYNKKTETGAYVVPHRRDVNFKTIEEAEQIDRVDRIREDKAYNKNSWLCNHKNLPSSVVKMIHDFVSYKPKPIIFLEEGDIHLDVTSTYGIGVAVSFVMIARPRGSS